MVENRPYLNFFTHLTLIIGVLLTLFPIWMTFVASTHTGEVLSIKPLPMWFGDKFLENYSFLITEGLPGAGGIPVGKMMLNSLIMAIGIASGKIIVSLLAAFAVVYFRFPLRMLFFWLIFITLMLPVEVRILPTFDVISRLDLLNTYAGLCVPLIASATATFLFRQFFMTIPGELVEAAKIDRAGPLKFFLDIVIPMSRTNIAALFIVLFVYGWNQYLWPLLVTTEEDYYTVVMGIHRMLNTGESLPVWDRIMGTVTLALLPPVLIVLLMQKLFIKGLVESEK